MLYGPDNKPLPPPLPPKKSLWERIKSFVAKFKRKYTGFIALLSGLIVILTFFDKCFTVKEKSEEIYNSEISKRLENTSFPDPDKNDSSFLILLLPFGKDATCELQKNKYHIQVHRRLERLIETEKLEITVRRLDSVSCDLVDKSKVEELGSSLDADLVIYGNYLEQCDWDTTQLMIQYLLLDTTIHRIPTFEKGEEEFKLPKQVSMSRLRSGKLTVKVEGVIYWALGVRELNSRRYLSALNFFEKIRIERTTAEYADLYNVIGYSLLNLGKWNKALLYFNQSINLDPHQPNVYYNKGLANAFLEYYVRAISDFSKVIDYENDNFIAYHYRGVSYRQSGNLNLAARDFENVVSMAPLYAPASYELGLCYYLVEDYDKALLYIKNSISLGFKHVLGDHLFFRARSYEAIGKYQLALLDYDSLIKNYSEHVGGTDFFNRGNVKSSLNDYDGSIQDYREAIRRYNLVSSDWLSGVYSNMGLSYAHLKQWEKVFNCLDTALIVYPQNPMPRILRARLNSSYRANYEKSIEDLNILLDYNPTLIDGYRERASTYLRMGDTLLSKRDRKVADSLVQTGKGMRLDITTIILIPDNKNP